MKKLLLVLFTACISWSLQAQFDAEKDPFKTQSLSNSSIQKVYARTSGGSISVTGVPAGEARIEVYVQPSNYRSNRLSKEEIQKRLDEDYDLVITTENNKLSATAKTKERNMDWKRGLSISFRIYVPQNNSTDLSTSGGSIHLVNLDGIQDFSTSGGSLHIDKVSGKINGRTSGGSIDITDSKDDIDLSTSGGSIHADNCNGTLKLNTSGGSLDLTSLQGNIKATTSGGSVHGDKIKGELAAHTSGGSVSLRDLSGSVESSTSGGNMDVEVIELGKYVTIDNSGGNINLKLPAGKGMNLDLRGDKIRIDQLTNFNGSKDDDQVDGTVNGGGVPVHVRAGSGRITLAMK